jgi:multiple sugar transport system ATP-binding protein
VVEPMCSELYSYFDVHSEGVQSAELVELAEDSGLRELPRHGGDEQQVVARLDAASRARPGEQAQLVLDIDKIMLFNPENGQSLAEAA